VLPQQEISNNRSPGSPACGVDQTEVLVQKQNRVDENPPRCRVTVNQPDYED